MLTGFDWEIIGKAVISLGILGAFLQAGTLWAFGRLSR